MIELRSRGVREGLFLFNLAGERETFDGAVVEVNGEDGVVFNHTIRLTEDWRARPWYVEACLQVAEAKAFRSAVEAALG